MFLVVPADIGKRIVRISPVNTTPIIIKGGHPRLYLPEHEIIKRTPTASTPTYTVRASLYQIPTFADIRVIIDRMMHIRIIARYCI